MRLINRHIITFVIIFNTIASVYSQSDCKYNPEKFIDRFSIGAGIGVQLPVGNYQTIKVRNLLGDFKISYKISNDFSTDINVSIENGDATPVSYLNLSAKYNYLQYRKTLYPYFEIGIGTYYGKELLVKDEVWMYYSERKSYFGGSIGTGLDIKLSPYAALGLNVKCHTFTFNEPQHFFTVLTGISFNL